MPATTETSISRQQQQRLRSFLFKSVALGIGLMAALIAAEVLLRAQEVRPERFPRPLWLTHHEGAFHEWGMWGQGHIKRPSRWGRGRSDMGEYVPGAVFQVVYASNPRGYFGPDNEVVFHINSHGMRGPEVGQQPAPGVFRILVLGDSFTFGVGVKEEDTFARRLESSLNERGDGREYQVLNAGVQGYNTYDEVAHLEHQWLAFAPDFVLIVFYLNDIFFDEAFLNNGEGEGVYAEPSRLAESSYLWDLLEHAWQSRLASRQMEAIYRSPYFDRPDALAPEGWEGSSPWARTRESLRRARELTQAAGAGLALCIFPELYKLDASYPFYGIHEKVSQACQELSIPCLDLMDGFRGQEAGDLWVHPTDHHPNEVAHGLAAREILAFVSGLLSTP